jgi:hypothetical protein
MLLFLRMNQDTIVALLQRDVGGECKNCAGIMQEKVQIHPLLSFSASSSPFHRFSSDKHAMVVELADTIPCERPGKLADGYSFSA